MGNRITFPYQRRGARNFPILGIALVLAACSSTPPRLFLLNAEQIQSSQHAELSGDQARGDVSGPLSRIKAGLSVTVPEYLDRPDIMVRSDSNELARLPD